LCRVESFGVFEGESVLVEQGREEGAGGEQHEVLSGAHPCAFAERDQRPVTVPLLVEPDPGRELVCVRQDAVVRWKNDA
jgi:hypothetical protein